MAENYFVSVRKAEKIQLMNFINENKDKPLSQIIGLFSFKTGYKTSTIKTYIEELAQAGIIKIEANYVI